MDDSVGVRVARLEKVMEPDEILMAISALSWPRIAPGVVLVGIKRGHIIPSINSDLIPLFAKL